MISTQLKDPSGDAVGYCEVTGYVAPSIGFLLRLPSDHWNGKFFETGCGGACGTFDWISRCAEPLRKGYACIVSDGGHKSTVNDLKWAYNNPQAPIDYLVRAPHVTALAGKAIVERYYNKAPQKSYFMGCSAGGIQALWETQRFPWDFDGIVAVGPALHTTGVIINALWANRALMGKTGEPVLGDTDLELLHQAVVAKCDMNDGIKDGVIGDPRACHFSPSELRCTSSKPNHCLTAEQIEAVEKIYGGPVTSKGEQIVRPAALKGSERTWPIWFGGSEHRPTTFPFYRFVGDWFRYSYFQPNPGPTWKTEDFDFDSDYKRLGMAEGMDPVNPDLRRFKVAGGKLMVVTGWNDAIEGALRTVDYYETVEKIMGGRAETQDFFRLFVIPGMEHCGAGDGAFAVDYLSYLEAWVEKGEAPDHLVGSHLRLADPAEAYNPKFPLDPAKIEFSRPVYPYPTTAKYLGHGNPNDAANFGPAKP
ncbi:MAG: tannase/feruloyl esterase family alpha/beta hydrolase [Acidobacteria bacterium]|nr:tannase/feruloyl esterase family alpha/beta hydrolase [Acidobacteriota bacterium]